MNSLRHARAKALDRRQAVIVGMEAHICVMQTGVNLMEEARSRFSSVAMPPRLGHWRARRPPSDRLSAAGAGIVTTERSSLSGWADRYVVKAAGGRVFKSVGRRIRHRVPRQRQGDVVRGLTT